MHVQEPRQTDEDVHAPHAGATNIAAHPERAHNARSVTSAITSSVPSLPAPLWAVLAFTFINSVATGISFNGLSFITERSYQYGPLANSLLFMFVGATYVAGALLTGPLLRRLFARFPGLTPRRVLAGLMSAATLLSALPVVTWIVVGPEARPSSAWSMWVFAGFYSGLCGTLWPIVESYLSGGRSGKRLRGDMSVWNITWSSALIVSVVSLGPLSKIDIIYALALGAVLHVVSFAVLAFLPSLPAAHAHEHAGPVPASYPRLLAVHRLLLPLTYVVIYALLPMLPGVMQTMLTNVFSPEVSTYWAAPVSSIWLAARVGTFFVLGRWQGWHGTWFTATAGTLSLLGGFGLCAVAPEVLSGWPALLAGLAGLCAIGIGAASIYCGALYYALEIGASEVEAGGAHEALIGVGYTVGPMCVLLPHFAHAQGWLAESSVSKVTLGLVSTAVVVTVCFALASASRSPRSSGA